MKKLFIILFLSLSLGVLAQERNDSIVIYEDYETWATFYGGQAALSEYLETNVQWPEDEPKYPKVFVSFIVNEDGTISDVKIAKGINERFDNEALRVIQNMPKWAPGKYMGKARKCRCIIPVTFNPNK